MYKVKELAKRGSAFFAAAGFLGVAGIAALPQTTYADALNPLTERSLLLSSSSPGHAYTDGSNNATFAPPGSGPNGMKTGQTFSFKVSTNSSSSGPGATGEPIKAITFQYCKVAAGLCASPGDNTSHLASSPNPNLTVPGSPTSDLDVKYAASPEEGIDFAVYSDVNNDGTINTATEVSTGWEITTATKVNDGTTERHNFITLAQTGTTTNGDLEPTSGRKMMIRFFASDDNYITNPGSGAFFVRMNTFSSDGVTTPSEIDPTNPNAKVIDGGVTVANVMTESIHITTKVVETMSFSVGTNNPDLRTLSGGSDSHGTCEIIDENDQLRLGNPSAEYSLETTQAYDTSSYWRLASNSSGGATVYYSGTTLSNTVGDDITEVGTTQRTSNPGTEQFGLAIATATDADLTVPDTGYQESFTDVVADGTHRMPGLYGLLPINGYGVGAGAINDGDSGSDATFAFTSTSSTTPVAIAQNNLNVIDCSTAKMRYVANIAPNTPAGVYTTKINYLAAPQY